MYFQKKVKVLANSYLYAVVTFKDHQMLVLTIRSITKAAITVSPSSFVASASSTIGITTSASCE